MSVDYDLVVIGGSPEGIYAAAKAVHLKARVALVTQGFEGQLEGAETIYSRAFSHFIRSRQQYEIATQGGFFPPTTKGNIPWNSLKDWSQEVISLLAEQNSPAILASLGVDIIEGSGEFIRLPQQAFWVNTRKLRSRAYLLATSSRAIIPNIEGLQDSGYLTPTDFWCSDFLEIIPDHLVIIGATPTAIELAQILTRCGKNITLVVQEKRLLPAEDLEASQLIQAELEAEGIKVFIQSLVLEIKSIGTRKLLQIENHVIETDEIVLVPKSEATLVGLNLEGVGIQLGKTGLLLNKKLQTTNPKIYACGNKVNGYSFTHISQYEADIAVKNALFLPLFKVNYHNLPYTLLTTPQLARVGMTESQARKHYGEDILVTQQYFKSIAQAQILGETSGFCKLIIRHNGEILGAHIVGHEAGELISAIAIAIKKKLKIKSMASFSYPSFTLSEIIQQTALSWQQQRFSDNITLNSWLETLFIWLRNWYS